MGILGIFVDWVNGAAYRRLRNLHAFRRIAALGLLTAITVGGAWAGDGDGTALAAASAAVANGAATASPPTAFGTPVDIVIAVDESASIQPSEMAQEQQATRLIALGEFSPDSKIGVLGFGGDNEFYNAATNPQVPFDTVCPMTEVNSEANRQGLSDCIGTLARRSPHAGNHTDFIDAINAAVADLDGTGDTGRPRLLFLLTDGQLDMVGSPGYSGTNQQINEAANQNLLTQTLPAAKAAGVRIWTLGFGSDVNFGELSKIAAGGAQASCSSLPGAVPHAVTVVNAAQVASTLLTIFAGARCLGVTPGTSGLLPSGGSLDLYVTVPIIATAGTIEVTRQNPQVQVSIYDPAGQQVPAQGTYDQSAFQLSGVNGPVEALAISNPVPGQWRIHLSAPAGLTASIPVTGSVLWQGVLHSDITVYPPQPKPGQAVTVEVRLQVRGQQIVDPTALAGVRVSADLSGAGFSKPVTAQLNDNGMAPDATAGDGVYTGTLSVPRAATGTLTFTGSVTGQGVVGDERFFSSTVAPKATVTGQIAIPAAVVAPGGHARSTIELSNQTGAAHTVRLVTVDTPSGVTVSPVTISLPAASGTTTFLFTVNFASSAAVGPVGGYLEARDVASGQVYAQAIIPDTVGLPPKLYQHWWFWVIGGVILVLILATIAALIIAARDRRVWKNIEQVEIVLYDGGREIDALQAPAGSGGKFSFSVDRSRPSIPRLQADFSEPGEYVAQRWRANRRGLSGIELLQHGRTPQRLDQPDIPIAETGDGTALGFRDLRLAAPTADDPFAWPSESAEEPEALEAELGLNGHATRRRWPWSSGRPVPAEAEADDAEQP